MSSSLSRAFTTKRTTKPDASQPVPKRSITTKHSFASGTIRNKISGPVELISTTNMLSYNAPDIHPANASPAMPYNMPDVHPLKTKSSISSSSSNSGDDSDRALSVSTPMTSPDTSSIELSPTSLEPNHLSCYFGAPSSRQSSLSASSEDAPVIPQRALSHTKKNAEALAHKRSVSRISSPKNSIISHKSNLSTARSSINMFTAHVETIEQHPFGSELAQVSELAEEYGISKEKMTVIEEEERELISSGLFKFRAEDYMNEIHGLFMSAFSDTRPPMASMWI